MIFKTRQGDPEWNNSFFRLGKGQKIITFQNGTLVTDDKEVIDFLKSKCYDVKTNPNGHIEMFTEKSETK